MIELKELLMLTIEKKASDLHLSENTHPILRIDGRLTLMTDLPKLTRDDTKRLIYSVLSNEQKEVFEKNWELDLSVAMMGMDRFRVNVHIQRGSVEAAFRRIPLVIPRLEDLGLPAIVADLAKRPNGLVLVTGPTGVGKTTTMAAMIDLINTERQDMIISIEDL